MHLQTLQDFITQIHLLKDDELQSFLSIWQPDECKRKCVLTRSGETEKHLYFVLEGVQRSYFVSSSGNESTLIFTYPFSFSGVADSFLTQTPSGYFLETLTASKFLRTSYGQVNALMQQYSNIQTLILKATAFALKGALERQVELQNFSAEEKFRKLLSRSPQVLNLIPHKYLASYLGIDAATFSKLLHGVRI